MSQILKNYILQAVNSLKEFYKQSPKLPIVVFYRYLWEHNRNLLLKTLFFNYIFPVMVEILPWWASRRKVGNKLRSSRIKLNHNMVTGQDFVFSKMQDFLLKCFLYIFLDSSTRVIKNRLALENKFIIKKLVLEKILYSESRAFETLNINTENLEEKITNDITETLNFINRYLPSLVSGLYAFGIESAMLYRKRYTIDMLAVIYPLIIASFNKLLDIIQKRYLKKKQKIKSKHNTDMLDSCMATAIAGFTDIQVNNLQEVELGFFERVAQKEINNKEGLKGFLIKSISTINQMSVFAYAIEVYFVHRIMKRQNFDHKQFSKIQQEIDHVVTLARNSYNLLTKSKSLFKYQSKVGKLLHIQNWRNEMQHLPTSEINEFTELRIRGVKFSYREDQLAALNLQDDQEILFEAGKKYALIGQNKAGKSTLTKIICKLYKPDEGYIALNGIPYSEIPRVVLRNLISYIPQKAFIFPGTIRENILVGNPNATEEELLAAAEAAGVFAFVVNDLSPAMRRTFSTPNFANQLSAASENKSPLKRTGLKPHPESSMLRTVSYKELDSIVSPHPESDFYSNSQFGMYPLVLPDRVRGKHTRSKKDKGPKPSSFLTDSIDWDSDDSDEDSSEDESRDENDSDEDSAESDERTQIMKTSADVMEDYADLTTSGEGEKKEKKKKKKKYKKSGSSLNLRTSYENSANFKSHKGDKLKHPILDQYIGGDVSGGFAQSISLARVFVRTSAKIVILDESMSQMDQIKVRSIVFPKLFQFVNRWNMCLIIITHNMTAMHDLDHIYVLHEGEIAHAGTHQQLLDSKAELYTQLLGQ